jgi:hypothetical protein
MPGDPKACREHASNCRTLAAHATNPSAKATFVSLAEAWERLAAELESAEVFLRAMGAVESSPMSSADRKPTGGR